MRPIGPLGRVKEHVGIQEPCVIRVTWTIGVDLQAGLFGLFCFRASELRASGTTNRKERGFDLVPTYSSTATWAIIAKQSRCRNVALLRQ